MLHQLVIVLLSKRHVLALNHVHLIQLILQLNNFLLQKSVLVVQMLYLAFKLLVFVDGNHVGLDGNRSFLRFLKTQLKLVDKLFLLVLKLSHLL